MKHDILFEPIQIGPVRIKNRLALAPTNTRFSFNHLAGDKTLGFYAARARGGLGLLIFEATMVFEDMIKTPNHNLWAPAHIPDLASVTQAIHSYGSKTFIQLSPGLGVQGFYHGSEVAPKAPSAVSVRIEFDNVPENLLKWYMKYPRMITGEVGETALVGGMAEEMAEEEIERRIMAFSRSCRLAINACFDGVEIHSCHGWLIHNLLSPRYNKRTDSWGGSLENRMRFLLRLIEVAKEVLGEDYPLGVRLSMDERNDDGIHMEEMKQVAEAAKKAGADYIHLSDGCIEQIKYLLPEEDGTMLEGAIAFKEITGLPIITPGLHDPDKAALAVGEGKTDMVSSSRAFIADPDWANKVKEGRTGEIRRCTRCSRCIFEFSCNRPIRCSVNKKLGLVRFELKKLLKS